MAAVLAFLLCILYPLSLFAEDGAGDPVLQAYRRRFDRAALSAKAEVLREAAADTAAAGITGPLYESALRFALGNLAMHKGDPDMIRLAGSAARGAGSAGFTGSLDTLLLLFASDPDPLVKTEIIGALGVLGRGNSRVIESLNRYLDDRNRLFRSGAGARAGGEYGTVAACIGALGTVGDDSSFPVLFGVLGSGYGEAMDREALAAMDAIPGNYGQFLLGIIRNNPPEEKLAACSAALGNARFSPAELGRIAEAALEQSLGYFPGSAGDTAALSGMGYASALALTRLQWTRGSAQAVRHFYRVRADFQQGLAPLERFLEAIDCLGAIGTRDAVIALGLQLGLLNAEAERTGAFNEDITLALVRALGNIGDKSAFDHLLYISYIPYPEHIKAAAEEALNRLKW
jgi:HEAT repeat protein